MAIYVTGFTSVYRRNIRRADLYSSLVIPYILHLAFHLSFCWKFMVPPQCVHSLLPRHKFASECAVSPCAPAGSGTNSEPYNSLLLTVKCWMWRPRACDRGHVWYRLELGGALWMYITASVRSYLQCHVTEVTYATWNVVYVGPLLHRCTGSFRSPCFISR